MLIKTNKRFDFVDNPNEFLKKDFMLSATRLAQEPRRFLLGLRHRPKIDKKAKIRMEAGKAQHEALQQGIKTLEEYGYIEYRKSLCTDHKRIKLKEVNVISPSNAIYGIIDLLTIEFTKEGELRIWIEEIKPRFSLNYLFQLISYVITLTDYDSRLVYGRPYLKKSKKNREFKREIGYLFPNPLDIKKINIFARIYSYNSSSESKFEEYVKNTQIIGDKSGICLATLKRIHTYQEYMMQKVVNLSDFDHDDNGYCCSNFPHICPKVDYNPKDKQLFFSLAKNPKNQTKLVKTKPTAR